jgi:hypothetical protein
MKIIPSESIEIISSLTVEECGKGLDDFIYFNKHRVLKIARKMRHLS